MNKKLIAAAVSAAVVAPVAAYGEATVYGRIRNAIDINDLRATPDTGVDTDSVTDISPVTSRFGIKYSQEMGNGLTAHGKYEFSTTTDQEGGGVEDTRVATVGLSGAFGRIDVGNQWSSYFNTFGTLVSPTYSLGYYIYSSIGSGPFRASNTIKYSNSFGPLYLELDVRLNGKEESGKTGGTAEKLAGDGVGLGLSWAVTDGLTIAVATDSEDGFEGAAGAADAPDTDRLGIGIKYSVGGYWISAGTQSHEVDDTAGTNDGKEVDSTIVYIGGNFSESTNWLLGVSSADNGDDAKNTDDASQTTWGLYHNLGGGLKLFYEGTSFENGIPSGTEDHVDGSRHYLGMAVHF